MRRSVTTTQTSKLLSKVFHIAIASTLLVLAGCGPRIDYSKLDPRCIQWNGRSNGQIDFNFGRTNPDINTYYEYFTCLNLSSYNIAMELGMNYFDLHASEFLRIASDKLQNSRADKETLFLSDILQDIHSKHLAPIAEDATLMSAWAEAINKIQTEYMHQSAYQSYVTVLASKQPPRVFDIKKDSMSGKRTSSCAN
jgi:hypothetical protein